jgi:hypothetical protein
MFWQVWRVFGCVEAARVNGHLGFQVIYLGSLSSERCDIVIHTRGSESAVTALAAEATAKLWAPPLERIPSLAL